MNIYALFEEDMYQRTGFIRFLLVSLFLIAGVTSIGTAVNTTPLGSPYIDLVPASKTVEVGDPIEIQGLVNDSIMGVNPGTALLIVKAPKSSKFDAFTQVAVNNNGKFAYSIPTDVTGTWSVSARYSDEISAVSDVTVNPRTTILKTSNLLNSYGAPVPVGNEVTMFGYLRDAKGVGVGDKPISYMVSIPPYGCSFCSDDDNSDYLIWETYGTVNTDSSGKYTFSFTPFDRGQYKVRTYFGGDEGYQSSSSDIKHVTSN